MSAGAVNDLLVRADLAFFSALRESDVAVLETLLADQFLIVDVTSGSVHTRAGFLAEAEIRVVGPGIGIVIGRTAMTLGDAEGAITEVASRYTHVFQLDGERW